MKQHKPPDLTPNVICPICGSDNTKLINDTKYVKNEGKELHEYKCESCKKNFIPAMESRNPYQLKVDGWAKQVRINGNNEGNSWRSEKDYIEIIREEVAYGDTDAGGYKLMKEICSIYVQVTGHQPDSAEYAKFVNGCRNSKYLTELVATFRK